eukprot:3770827-Pleurochrysis_carterae.AAC.1
MSERADRRERDQEERRGGRREGDRSVEVASRRLVAHILRPYREHLVHMSNELVRALHTTT